MKSKRIAVVMGGTSAEREVSLRTGAAVLDALLTSGYDAVGIDSAKNLPEQLRQCGAEIVFVAVHGRHGEDGAMQGLLEMMEIPYTGSGVLASALAIDKAVTKQMVANVVDIADSFLVDENSDIAALCAGCSGYPQVVKPVREGSTLGITIVADAGELEAAIAKARTYDSRVLVEDYVAGREVTVAVISGKALPVIEVIPAQGFYDYAAKYTAGTTQYLVPAPLSDGTYLALQRAAERCYIKLGCRGAARVDFIVSSDDNGEFCFLEVNTIPGMTKTSLLPKAAACDGIKFASLVELLVKDASIDR
ncbi:MAG: D-alanine--D-alanine ligase [Desulfobacteraceae bacterium 4572_35.1]|nr:MAG: D-alanine--D-alanine ligase [Desulfobacteraceae bacterium 4572_35.1]